MTVCEYRVRNCVGFIGEAGGFMFEFIFHIIAPNCELV